MILQRHGSNILPTQLLGEIYMNTCIAYFDETGDDGNKSTSSETFILTSLYMPSDKWQSNFNLMKECRNKLRIKYGFHTTQEMHTKHFLTDKSPYREYGWDMETRRLILKHLILFIGALDAKVVNVIIDKSNIKSDDYNILENALKYNIQRIENDSSGKWNYLLITDEGRVGPMRKTARSIRTFNPIRSVFDSNSYNRPIQYLIEDIFEKDSKESYFIQICDFISYFVHLYYKTQILKQPLPKRVGELIDEEFIIKTMNYFKDHGIFNLHANSNSPYGLVVYPKG